jgi:hypothetical protein
MQKSQIILALNDQQERFYRKESIVDRNINLKEFFSKKHIVVITGIRRSGKSTLLKLFSQFKKGCYVRFDDVRFSNFEISDFEKIEEYALQNYGSNPVFYLDEVQEVPLWEKWVNDLFTKGYKVFVTGSNASLLSSELSAQLTGRHVEISLFPFSFKEIMSLQDIDLSKITIESKAKILTIFKEYLSSGGFPDVVLTNDVSLASQYYQDIVNRDIILRHKFKSQKDVMQFGLYVLSNATKLSSYNKIKSTIGIKSLETVKSYLDAFSNAYVLYPLQRFDYSVKKQIATPSKLYVGDQGFISQVGFHSSNELGRLLENLVLLELKRRQKQTYYHREKKECDFVIKEGLDITSAIQVCYELTDENKKREIEGLIEACKIHSLSSGLILTYDQEDEFDVEGVKISVKPVWKWLLE